MAFIPANPQIGDRVRLTQDVQVLSGTYTKGHEFVITSHGSRGYTMEGEGGRGLYDVHPALFGGQLPFTKI